MDTWPQKYYPKGLPMTQVLIGFPWAVCFTNFLKGSLNNCKIFSNYLLLIIVISISHSPFRQHKTKDKHEIDRMTLTMVGLFYRYCFCIVFICIFFLFYRMWNYQILSLMNYEIFWKDYYIGMLINV